MVTRKRSIAKRKKKCEIFINDNIRLFPPPSFCSINKEIITKQKIQLLNLNSSIHVKVTLLVCFFSILENLQIFALIFSGLICLLLIRQVYIL